MTLACNLRCAHCGSSAGEVRRNELSLAEALKICDQFPDLLVQEVDFTGGEPLLSGIFPAVTAHLRGLDIPFKALTNGVILSPELIMRLKESGLAGIGISLDGTAETHDRIRLKPGLFDHIRRQIPAILSAGIPLTIITTANAKNIAELPELLEILTAEGVGFWQVQPFFPLGRGRDNDWLRLTKEDYLKLGDFVNQWTGWAAERGMDILPADSYGYFGKRDQREPAWEGCSAGLYACGITSDGKIKGCLSMPDNLVEGDLREHELWDIWFDPHVFAYNRQFSCADLGENCAGCALGDKCKGGCSAMSVGCTGEFHNDPMCFYRLENIRDQV
ncbi:MAG TPA: radical SAM protein [Longilinea sp.]|nr:radical SAM protein [Longilinea sp.]